MFVILFEIIGKNILQRSDKLGFVYKADPEYKNYQLWVNAPVRYKIASAIIPLVNTFFALMSLVLIYIEAGHYWFKLGGWVTDKFTKDKNDMRLFRLKYWIIHIFFNKWTDLYLRRYEWDIIERMYKTIYKTSKDENKKDEREPEQDSEPDADTGNKETPACRKENNPD